MISQITKLIQLSIIYTIYNAKDIAVRCVLHATKFQTTILIQQLITYIAKQKTVHLTNQLKNKFVTYLILETLFRFAAEEFFLFQRIFSIVFGSR